MKQKMAKSVHNERTNLPWEQLCVQDLAQNFFSFVSVKTSHKALASFGPFTIYNFARRNFFQQNFNQKDGQLLAVDNR